MIDSTGLAARRPPDQRPLGATTAAEWSVAATRGAPSRRHQHERRRAADLGIRTLHGRQAPPPGRQPTTRRQSRSHSGPPEGLPNPPVHLSVPPRNPKKCPSTPFPSAAGSARSATPASCLDAIEGPACGRRVAAPSRLPQPPAASRRAAGRVRASSGSMSTAAPPISAFGPLHGRQAPPPGRQPTTRRQSRSHSGPLRVFQTRRCTSAYPPENPKSARQRRFPAPLTPPGPPRRHPYLEHQSDTGAPSPSWHPPAYHGVAYTDRSNARMALMAPLHMRDLPTLSSAASSCWVPPAVFRSARRSPIEQNSPWSTISRPLCAPPSARRPSVGAAHLPD